MKKTYILDTNILLDDPNSIISFEENDIVVPLVVLEELDRHKDRNDNVGTNAREVSRKFDALIREHGHLRNGVPLSSKGTLRVASLSDYDNIPTPRHLELGDYKTGDNRIIDFTLKLIGYHKSMGLEPPILVTKDVLLRVKCDALNIPCENRKKDAIISNVSKLYSGHRKILVSPSVVQSYYECFNRQEQSGKFYLAKEVEPFLDDCNDCIYPNQYITLRCEESNVTLDTIRFDGATGLGVRLYDTKLTNFKPRNLEQRISLDMLFNDDIQLCTMTGFAGTGKTILAIAAGLEQVNTEFDKRSASKRNGKRYDSLMVTKPVHAVGKDIGYLPGTKQEKMDPWIAPIKDNLRYLIGKGKRNIETEKILHDYFETGIIEIEAITYMRGRSVANTFMLIDEVQNINAHELKTIITRVGENTKIVLIGDVDQVDNLQVDSVTNGLTIAIEKFKDSNLAAHITLQKGERSKLATEAAKLL